MLKIIILFVWHMTIGVKTNLLLHFDWFVLSNQCATTKKGIKVAYITVQKLV